MLLSTEEFTPLHFNIYFYEYECCACVYFVYPMGPVLMKPKGVLGSLALELQWVLGARSLSSTEHQTFFNCNPGALCS